MANRARPRCPKCESVMSPVYRKGVRAGFVRLRDAFVCIHDGTLARGRRKPRTI